MYQVYLADHFLRQLKSFLKKYRNLEKDLIAVLQEFTLDTAQHLGQKLYKIRLKSSDIPRGKNKAFRLIVFILEVRSTIIPITLYFKGDRANISAKEIEYHLAMILVDIQKKKYLSK